ncbi:MAG: hypothetical protein KIS94_04590 [Chitinophagales bacterium]|nr:hypothetical protein [Chitinophagales bacterium]
MFSNFSQQNFYELLNRFTVSQLEDMVSKYPFQHETHLLLAKKYQQENHPRFDEQLQLAAIYTQDRELFFSLFNNFAPIKKGMEFTPQSESVIAAIEPVLEEEVSPPQVTEQPEVTEPVESTEVKTETPEQAIAENQQSVVPKSEEHTFDEWLHLFTGSATQTNAVVETNLPAETVPDKEDELELLILQNTPVDFLHELVKEETQYSKGLDEFIEQQIQKKKQTEVKRTLSENEIAPEMVTETLAKLYEAQKKYAKAIKAYEALALKYPGKNDLFAARINYLKNLI